MKIIPAIDIINGRCVRLTQGDYDRRKVYMKNPLDVAKSYEDAGIQHLHLVDLDGAKASKIVNYSILEKIASETKLIIDFGGGIKRDEDLKIAFESGADKVTGGSIAVQNPTSFSEWIANYGSKIILGADSKNRKIATQGWTELADIDVIDFIQNYQQKGIEEVICTDISKDGMMQGPSFALYAEIMQRTKIDLIASGGVSSVEDLQVLREMGCAGAIVGKAIYEGRISLQELKELC
ncbi:MAG: 1-(5-phosphoribosyl)-5-[(5-phosphoribosylamino)methylideneamino]imidazole-4-carboxamide isomerase [Flavobacteriales bacterium]|nr:1-(5-phosphoribosyl)-5-[(5-phosphoribosylamino)methylideneamino]imidazole-4-carboxamide isomerase [Flavobacteriales bacterium]